LRDLGFRPGTVIDVGVAEGTIELYRAFPESYFLLIEPLSDFVPDMESILRHFNGSYILAAAGPKSGLATINVHDKGLDGSSLYKESAGPQADGHETRIPMIRIDDVLLEKQLRPPYLIKVDVQGGELDVLEGGQRALMSAEAVSLEVSLFQFFKGGPQLSEVVEYMKKRDFVVFDVVLAANRPLDNALAQLDVVFVRQDGMFRRSHLYSAV
jgi:FkbM family methyltransferase